MRRHSWLIAIALAFFASQMPLCALACSDLDEAVAHVEAAPPSIATAGCHEQTPDGEPVERSDASEDCGCLSASRSDLFHLVYSNANTLTALEIFTSAASDSAPLYSSHKRVPRVAQTSDLPQPDILLRKSTLII